MNFIIVYLLLLLLTVINIIIPFSGAVSTTPLLAALTDTHKAIAISGLYYFVGNLIRGLFFYKFINWVQVKKILPSALCGSAAGALALIALSDVVATVVLFFFILYFLIVALCNKKKEPTLNKKKKYVAPVVGSISGFFQGSGFAGSDLRNGYLYAEGLTLSEVQGTASIIGGSTFLLVTLIRVYTHQLQIVDSMIVLYLIPAIVVGTYIGRRAIVKVNKMHSRILVLIIMTIALGSIFMKLIHLLK